MNEHTPAIDFENLPAPSEGFLVTHQPGAVGSRREDLARARGASGSRCGAEVPSAVPRPELEVALEATTGWRFVVEELRRVGAVVHLAEPAETAGLKGPKKRAKGDRADARHLRSC